MDTSAIFWQRPDIRFPEPFDTIFFDVDGVLIDTIASFHATDIAVAVYVAGTIHSLDWGQHEGKVLISIADVDAFKQAGGYNNDWDMCYLLSALATSRLREWKGIALAERTSQEWAAISRAANLHGHGGREWVDATFPASARMDYNVIGDIYHEYYWGADDIRKRYGHEPRYLPDFKGFVHQEKMLYTPNYFTKIRHAGIQHMGMITGRVGPEVDSALERMEAYSGEKWWDVVVAADLCPKPDPRALRLALEATGARGGLYIGDTADDLDLIKNYQHCKATEEPNFLAAVLVMHPQEVELYRQRGADFVVRSVEDLFQCLPQSLQK